MKKATKKLFEALIAGTLLVVGLGLVSIPFPGWQPQIGGILSLGLAIYLIYDAFKG